MTVELGENPSIPFLESIPEGTLVTVTKDGIVPASAVDDARSTVVGVRAGNRIVSSGIVPMRVSRFSSFKRGRRMYLSDTTPGIAHPYSPVASSSWMVLVGLAMEEFQEQPDGYWGDEIVQVFFGGLSGIIR